MTIIITGATGSLGGFLTRWFSRKGHKIFASGRLENPPPKLPFYSTYVHADVTRSFVLPPADVCIHCAGLADDQAKPSKLYAVNVEGTRRILAAASNCQTFIHVSSSSVYLHSDTSLGEDMVARGSEKGLSAYGKSKLFSEQMVAMDGRFASCYILRPRAIYGAGDKILLPRLLKLMNGNRMLRPGKMTVKSSLTHFANFAHAVERCIDSSRPGTHIYNVADDEIYTLYNVVKRLLLTLYPVQGPERKIPFWVVRLMAEFGISDATPLFLNTVSKSLVLDISKIKRELGYSPTTNFELSLQEIDDWVKAIGGIEVLKKADRQLAWTAC